MFVSPNFDLALATLLGMLIGSFLNVVIYRMPKMMERQWADECAALAGSEPKPAPSYNLWMPRSACTHCGHQIRWYENLPVISYLALQGKCSSCSSHIPLRYPLIEIATGGLFAACFAKWGFTPEALAWSTFSAILLTLAVIDWDTTLLPDDLTLPLLWIGLCSAALGWTATGLAEAFWGAVAGYLSLWLVFWGFKLATGKDGMGYGDFKLFAALGAWFGWQALVPIILMSSVVGAVIGIVMKLSSKLREGGYIPFGPFLAVGGFTALWVSPEKMLELVGF